MNPRNVLVTTTPFLEGWTIEKYLTYISAHVVAGTNIFSDIAASFSDLFGGRSRSYQKQLAAIDNEAVNALKQKASVLGANCIIGLRIDHDNISGHGKSMFMVTATGTAVIAHRTSAEDSEEASLPEIFRISKQDIKNQIKRADLIVKANNNKLLVDSDTWEFIINNRITELGSFILNLMLTSGFLEDEDYLRTSAFFSNLSKDDAKDILYSALLSDYPSSESIKRITKIIYDSDLIDYSRIKSLLEGSSLSGHKASLRLLNYYPESYEVDDIERLEQILELLQQGFPERVERFMKKALLTGKEVEHWKCTCGASQSIERTHCQTCGSDWYGFDINDPSVDKTIKSVRLQLNALRQICGITQPKVLQ